MADPRYEMDDQGNLVNRDEEASDNLGQGVDPPVTAADRRRFLRALLVSDLIGVTVLVVSGLLLPESRTILLILGAAYALVSVPIYLWMSRSTQRKVEAGGGRYSPS
jgi:hypothetical protein